MELERKEKTREYYVTFYGWIRREEPNGMEWSGHVFATPDECAPDDSLVALMNWASAFMTKL